MQEFSFGVVTYNSAETIIETLESIKYQIVEYGNNINNYLVVSDDSSTDETVYLVNKWLEYNEGLFLGTKVVNTARNSGLCVNYELMLSHINTDYFIQLAGDDLICSYNVYKLLSTIKSNEFRVHMPLTFSDNVVEVSEENIARQLYYMKVNHTNKYDLHLIETVMPYSSVEVAFRRHHYTKECMSFIKQFRNFEDDTSLFYIFRHNNKAFFSFVMEPLVLYRRSGTSLTTSVDNSNQIRFLDDLHLFRKIKFRYENNIFYKLVLFFMVKDSFLMKHRFGIDGSLYRKFLSHTNDKAISKANNDTITSLINEYKNILKEESLFLKKIKDKSDDFVKFK